MRNTHHEECKTDSHPELAPLFEGVDLTQAEAEDLDYADKPWEPQRIQLPSEKETGSLPSTPPFHLLPPAQDDGIGGRRSGRPPGKRNKEWLHVDEGSDLAAIRKRASELGFISFNKGNNKHEYIHLYKCKEPDCPSQLRVVDDMGSGIATLQELANVDHVHRDREKEVDELLEEVWVYDLYDMNAHPTYILQKLLKKHPQVVIDDRDRVTNLISKRKGRWQEQAMKDFSCINTTELKEMLEGIENLDIAEQDLHRIKILGSHVGNGSNKEPIYIVISTVSLLENLLRQAKDEEEYFCVDATYKLNDKKYPLLVLGTQDRSHKFHLVAFCVSSQEDEGAYSFFFQSIKRGMEKHFNIDYKPKYIMSDGALAIFNAAEAVFGADTSHLMCFFHVSKAVEKHMKEQKLDVSLQASIENAISNMRFCSVIHIFDVLWELVEKT